LATSIHEVDMSAPDFSRRTLLAAVAALAVLPAAAQGKPKIGIIGAGRIGGTLAKLWAEAGYPVMLSARDIDDVKKQAAAIGHGAQAGTPADAAAFGDVVLISVPFGALPQIGKDYAVQLKGKVVLDTCNPYVSRDGDMAKEALAKGTGITDPIYLPGTKLVRAFNQISAAQLASEAHRAGERIAVPLAADDPQALAIAKQLVTDAGFEPVVVGGLTTAKSFDPGAAAYHTMTAKELRAALGLKP
jgi:8-hydroxy-5-deazaflavin:NADPH oxidoreductase